MYWRCELFSFFFFKQKTAYEMRISDWSSDVCSSDLRPSGRGAQEHQQAEGLPPAACGPDRAGAPARSADRPAGSLGHSQGPPEGPRRQDRNSVVQGRCVSGSVDLGGCRINKTTPTKYHTDTLYLIMKQ